MKYPLILPAVFFSVFQLLYADTIVLRDGQELKGVIVEDYHDRVVISTEKAETGVAKANIDRIAYDNPQENLVKLGAFYKDKGDYKSALYYYNAALKISPDMKEAREGATLVENMIMRQKESELQEEVALKQDIEDNMGTPEAPEKSEAALFAKNAQELLASIGISIENVGADIKVGKVTDKSPAYEAGFKAGDMIISVWGKLVKYMPLKDVYALFLGGGVSEIRVVIARERSAQLKSRALFGSAEDMIGARLSMELDGLTVKEVRAAGSFDNAGIIEGDRITKLGGDPTRYMPLESAYKMIEGIKDGPLNMEIQREVVLWRR